MHFLLGQLPGIGRHVIGENLITIVRNRIAKGRFRDCTFIVLDAGASRAQIDVGFEDPRYFAQGTLVPHRAGSAVHTPNGEGCRFHDVAPGEGVNRCSWRAPL